MAWLRSVTVSGLAGHDGTLTLKFNRDVNVLWGLNGSGKTSLLKILHSALRDDATSLVRVPFDSAEVVFVHETPDREVVYTRTLSRHRTARQKTVDELISADTDTAEYAEMLIEDSRELRWTTKPRVLERRKHFAHRYLPISRVTADSRVSYRPYAPERADTLDEALLDKLFANDLQRLWQDYSIRSSGQIFEVQRKGIASILQAVIQDPTEYGDMPAIDVGTGAAYTAIRTFFEQQNIPLDIGSAKQFAEQFAKNPVLQQVVAKVLDIQNQTRTIEAPMRRIESIIHNTFSGGKQPVRSTKAHRPRTTHVS